MTSETPLANLSGRRLKNGVRRLLESDSDPEQIFSSLEALRPRQAVNPLFACFYADSPLVKWRAVAAMGQIVSGLAARDMESARVIMRRLMWNLNDESGGIGWGSPEAMGEITAQNHRLAGEYGRIVASYVCREQNFLEHPGLQRGSIWAVGRLAEVHAELVADTAEDLRLFLASDDPFHRGYAARALGLLQYRPACPELERLRSDQAEITIFRNLKLAATNVSSLAGEALAAAANGEKPC
ncbi:MAG: HEAT repeat domain-containing protein [Desulfosalsimonadaceae bacterium]